MLSCARVPQTLVDKCLQLQCSGADGVGLVFEEPHLLELHRLQVPPPAAPAGDSAMDVDGDRAPAAALVALAPFRSTVARRREASIPSDAWLRATLAG